VDEPTESAEADRVSEPHARRCANEAYPGPTWDRLAAVKSRYDPTNLFRLNQNIPPAVA
jgi:FAD/FMN-containing dehydrogenase